MLEVPTKEKVNAVINELEHSCNSGAYTTTQRHILHGYVPNFGFDKFKKAVTKFIERGGKLPSPLELKTQMQNFSRVTEEIKSTPQTICEHCRNTGWVNVETSKGVSGVFAKCLCMHGEMNTDPDHPQVNENQKKHIKPFPSEYSFKPGEDLWQKIEEWKGAIEISRLYWKSKKGVK